MLDTIRYAMEYDTLDLFMQPVIELGTKKVRYFECYSRVRGPDEEYIMPARFLKLATEAGVITDIDNRMLMRSIQIVNKLKRSGRDVAMFCNVSATTLRDEDFLDRFIHYLSSHRELVGHIIFEMSQARPRN